MNWVIRQLSEVEDPSDILHLVEQYAFQSGKNSWECLAGIMAPGNWSAWIYDGNKYIGYTAGYVNTTGEFYIHTGYMDMNTTEAPDMFNAMCKMYNEVIPQHPVTFTIQTAIPGRLWKKYGLLKSEVVYKKTIGGNYNGQ